MINRYATNKPSTLHAAKYCTNVSRFRSTTATILSHRPRLSRQHRWRWHHSRTLGLQAGLKVMARLWQYFANSPLHTSSPDKVISNGFPIREPLLICKDRTGSLSIWFEVVVKSSTRCRSVVKSKQVQRILRRWCRPNVSLMCSYPQHWMNRSVALVLNDLDLLSLHIACCIVWCAKHHIVRDLRFVQKNLIWHTVSLWPEHVTIFLTRRHHTMPTTHAYTALPTYDSLFHCPLIDSFRVS